MTPWLAHYGSVVNQDFDGQAGYISARGNFARSQLPAEVPFSITTSGGNDFTVATTTANLEGRGWINIREFRLAGSGTPLPVEWLDGATWRATLPLIGGANAFTIETYDFQGALLDTRDLTITSTATTPTPREFLRITEIHYHPAQPTTAAELNISGDPDEFEFVELRNIGTAELDVGGVHFADGINFAFAEDTTITAGGYIVAVRDRAAFEARYGDGITIAGEYQPANLRNSGETLDLRDASGIPIQQFAYDDGDWYPETDGLGRSLHIADDSNPDLAAWGNRAAWVASSNVHGNPGAPNPEIGASYAEWQSQHFSAAEIADPDLSGLAADFNGDGMINLLKYAFGLDPRVQNPAGVLPQASPTGDSIQLTFRRQIGASDLEYVPEFSADLVSWQTLSQQAGAPQDNRDGTETVTFGATGLPAGTAQRFGRLRVNLLPP